MQVSNDANGAGSVTLAVFSGTTDTGTTHLTVNLTGGGIYNNLSLGPIPNSYVTSPSLTAQIVSVTGSVSSSSVGVTSNVLTNCVAPRRHSPAAARPASGRTISERGTVHAGDLTFHFGTKEARPLRLRWSW